MGKNELSRLKKCFRHIFICWLYTSNITAFKYLNVTIYWECGWSGVGHELVTVRKINLWNGNDTSDHTNHVAGKIKQAIGHSDASFKHQVLKLRKTKVNRDCSAYLDVG